MCQKSTESRPVLKQRPLPQKFSVTSGQVPPAKPLLEAHYLRLDRKRNRLRTEAR